MYQKKIYITFVVAISLAINGSQRDQCRLCKSRNTGRTVGDPEVSKTNWWCPWCGKAQEKDITKPDYPKET